MNATRAQFLLDHSNEWTGPSIAELETEQERKFVLAFWEKMPGNTCYIDAVRRISKGIPAEYRRPRP